MTGCAVESEAPADILHIDDRIVHDFAQRDDEAGQEMKAKYPLREARVDVTEIPGKPGVYRAVAFLKPHYQLDELTISLRLVADLPPPAA